MRTTTSAERSDLMERVAKLAWQEADTLAAFAQRRLVHQDGGDILTDPQRVMQWAREITEALVLSAGGCEAAGSASRIWARVRAMLMQYTLHWTPEEFVIYHLTKDQYSGFPYGLAVSDLRQLAGDEFPQNRIRSTMDRLARRKLIRKCRSKRLRHRAGNPIPIAEHVWIYSGPSSEYARCPDRVLDMHTQDEPEHGSASAA